MSKDILRAQEEFAKKLAGDGPIQRQMILLKLTDLMNRVPTYESQTDVTGNSPERRWLAQAGALLHRVDSVRYGMVHTSAMRKIAGDPVAGVNRVIGAMVDAVEGLKLELELDGRSEIGNAYAPGDTYKYYADLKQIIAAAQQQIFVIDPYFDGATFDAYFSEVHKAIEIHILTNRFANDLKNYVVKHAGQYGTITEIRKSKDIHDRLIIIDKSDCWVTGGSVKDAGKKPGYLLPLSEGIAESTRQTYTEVWDNA